jgi:hypothetical protein
MNIDKYTVFQNISVGQVFIDSEGHAHQKINGKQARYFSPAFTTGYKDYEFAAEDRLRVQPT